METNLIFIFHLLQIIFLIILWLPVIYIFVFAFAGLFYRQNQYPQAKTIRKMAVLIPGYKEDDVIVDVANQALTQNYPKEKYDVVIIADSFQKNTIEKLKQLPIRLIEVSFEKSTKSKALNKAMEQLENDYDIAVVLDADNIMAPDFLTKINAAFELNSMAIQGHRTAKNLNTSLAILDAISEEINNHIFRKGHRALGLSSAIIGSGMAFRYSYFKEMMSTVTAIGGFDKEIELKMLKAGHKIAYLDDALVFDEKVQKAEVFSNQRRRWLSAQLHYFSHYFFDSLKHLLMKGNVDYFDKAVQFIQPPRVLLLGAVLFFGTLFLIANIFIESQWIYWLAWIKLILACVLAFLVSIPRRYYNTQTLKALANLPKGMFLMLGSLLRIKGANKQFIHTQHGIKLNLLKMKIGIEAQRIFRKKKHGMDMVALELIRNLQLVDHENEYVVFVKPDEDDQVIQETSNFKIVKLGGGFYPIWEQIALPKAAAREKCDILHCTSNTAPVFTSVPVIDILHDIIYMEHSYLQILRGSGTPYQKFGNIYRKLVVPRVVKRSCRITTVSHFEKNRIGEFFEMKGDPRLKAVYNGVGNHFKPITDKNEISRIKEKYRLPEHFFFFLGNTDPKKNTKGTLKAFSDYLKQTSAEQQLVMLDYDRVELGKIVQEIGDPALIKRIVLTGYVANTDLPGIYSQCDLFLYPSLRESFGIPMLEAMACGAPVITSNTSSMPEVAGDAALLIDPFKPEEITEAMIKLLSDIPLKEKLIQLGYQQSARFSWKAMAEQVLKIYHEIELELQK